MTPRKRVYLAGGFLLLSLVFSFLGLPDDLLGDFVRHAALPFLAILLVLFLASLIIQLKKLPLSGHRSRFSIGIIVLILCCSAFQLVHEDFGYKIVMDEYILVSTSYNIHMERDAYTPTQGKFEMGQFVVSEGFVDKRPFLFPFLVSILHDITGYRSSNANYLNCFLIFVFSTIIYLMGYHLGKRKGGVVALLLATGLPLIAQNATGAGFELLNLTLLALIFYLSLSITKRSSREKENLLIFASLLLANVRYESMFFLLPVGIILLLRWFKNSAMGPSWWTIPSALFLIPVFVQIRWLLLDKQRFEVPEGVENVFSLSYLSDNIGSAIYYFFNISDEFPNSIFLTLVGGIGSIFLLLFFFKRLSSWFQLRVKDYDILGLWALALIAELLIVLCYWFGKLDNHFATRLGLPFHLLFIISPVWLLVKTKANLYIWKTIIILAVVSIIGFAAPHSSRAIFSKKNFREREFQWVYEKLEGKQASQFLVIDQHSMPYVVEGYQSLRISVAVSKMDLIKRYLNMEIYEEVFVVQRISVDPSTGTSTLLPDQFLPEDIVLEPMGEYISKPFQGVRFSKLVY